MRFLCLGDSLTAGDPGYNPSNDGISHGYGTYNSQYEFWLKQKAIELIEGKKGSISDEIVEDLVFINKGVCGEITMNFLGRINIDLLGVKPKPDYSIIIGGTNDLGWGISNNEIVGNIKHLHAISRKNGIKSIGGTIPPIRTEQSSGQYNKKKIQVNEMLKDYFIENEIPFADLYNGMADESGNLKKECAYIDGLHFSVEGYRVMGLTIFKDAVKEIIEKEYF